MTPCINEKWTVDAKPKLSQFWNFTSGKGLDWFFGCPTGKALLEKGLTNIFCVPLISQRQNGQVGDDEVSFICHWDKHSLHIRWLHGSIRVSFSFSEQIWKGRWIIFLNKPNLPMTFAWVQLFFPIKIKFETNNLPYKVESSNPSDNKSGILLPWLQYFQLLFHAHIG